MDESRYSEQQVWLSNPSHDVKYAYLCGEATIDGVLYDVTVTVRKSRQKNKFWIHEVRTKKNKHLSPVRTSVRIRSITRRLLLIREYHMTRLKSRDFLARLLLPL